MQKTLFCLLLATTLAACGPVRESFVDVCTGEKIAGYDKACQWRIGKTQRQEMIDEMVREEPRLSFLFST